MPFFSRHFFIIFGRKYYYESKSEGFTPNHPFSDFGGKRRCIWWKFFVKDFLSKNFRILEWNLLMCKLEHFWIWFLIFRRSPPWVMCKTKKKRQLKNTPLLCFDAHAHVDFDHQNSRGHGNQNMGKFQWWIFSVVFFFSCCVHSAYGTCPKYLEKISRIF